MNDTTLQLPEKISRTKDPSLLHRRALRIIKGTARFEDRYIPNHDELIALVETMQNMGCAIVLTMGTWDFFHMGHSEYIRRGKEEAAKLCADAEHLIMIVAVDTDRLTRERKGPKRPFVPENERARMIEQLRSVDIVTLEDKLRELPPKLPHDVRVISQSTNDPVALEAQQRYCTHLVNLPPQLDDSSTARIRRLALEGKLETIEKVEKGLEKLLREIRSEDVS
jgi:cytidyltransferase-like protein